MLGNQHLYGEDVEVPEIPAEIIMRRVELLKDHLDELLDVPWYLRDGGRCNDVMKVISFWKNINNREI